MTGERWRRIEEVFDQVVDLAPAEQLAALKAACKQDTGLFEEVSRYLRAQGGDRIAATIEGLASLAVPPERNYEGRRLGAYRIVREIGRGGMGVVFEALRDDNEFSKRVALKIALGAFWSPELASRFRNERQILAQLEHPNIARLLDGGATEEGVPYFAMEFVEGEPIDRYVERHRLGVADCIRLFLDVCDGVEHAHQNLVIHRDLKPGNILVSDGRVRLIDFGVAKLLDSSDTSISRTGTTPATPDYCSPEQASGQPVTTRTDVYALGLVLYKLLTSELGQKVNPAPLELVRSICEVPVPRPSDVVAARGDKARARQLRGDLDTILLTATHKDPARRYGSAAELREDLRNVLESRPIRARRDNRGYLMRRFARRHWLPVSAAGFVLAAVLAGIVTVSYQNRTIQRERDRAETIARFMQDLFSSADPERNQGNRLSTRETLDLGAARVRALPDPDTRAALMETIAEAYLNLGLYDKASRAYEESIRGEQTLRNPDRSRLARAYGALAEAEAYRRRNPEADTAARTALELARQLPAGQRAMIWLRRCTQLDQANQLGPALEACDQAARDAEGSTLGRKERAQIQMAWGFALVSASRLPEAEKRVLEALRLAESSAEPLHSTTAQASSYLGSLYFRQGKYALAEESFRKAIHLNRRLYPDGHLLLARALNNLANTLASLRRPNDAIPVYEEAHSLYRKFVGSDSQEMGASLSNLAAAHQIAGNLDRAETVMVDAMKVHERVTGRASRHHATTQVKYGALLFIGKKFALAEPHLKESLEALKQLDPLPKMEIGYGEAALALVMVETGRSAPGEALARQALETLQPMFQEDHWMVRLGRTALGGALARQGKREQARAILTPLVAASAAAEGWRSALPRKYLDELNARQ